MDAQNHTREAVKICSEEANAVKFLTAVRVFTRFFYTTRGDNFDGERFRVAAVTSWAQKQQESDS